jgi:hypothetical protein
MKIAPPIQQTLARPADVAEAPQPAGLPRAVAPPAPPPLTNGLAIVVVHGMGQQIPFETIDQVTRGLQTQVAQQRNMKIDALPEPQARVVKMDKQYVRALSSRSRGRAASATSTSTKPTGRPNHMETSICATSSAFCCAQDSTG